MNENNTGQDLYNKAKRIIPGGTMLLSKRPEMFLPEKWPSYYSKAKGVKIWDLDNNQFTDMCIMGIGTNILGYGNKEVDKAVLDTISKGNMSTLNCPEEVLLAEKLIEINPWAQMVRFARTGGEANAIAIRIARAASGKNNIAICGYHGWHDWYLSVNLNSKGEDLTNHLLPGLEPNGVPNSLKNTVFPFTYNNYEELESIVSENDIGVIKMEVERSSKPENDFLKKVRKLATERGIVLIFDECTSGFRETFGGIFKKYDVEPDIAMFGKALGNGYAITAVVGKKEIMEAAQSTFISSTFWTERVGPTAALKTLELMEKYKSWERITYLGEQLRNGWINSAKNNKIEISTFGIPALSTFTFNHPDSQKFKTFLTQEFLKKEFLASTIFYASIEHNEKIIEEYLDIFDALLHKIKTCIEGVENIDKILEVPVSNSGFRRLN